MDHLNKSFYESMVKCVTKTSSDINYQSYFALPYMMYSWAFAGFALIITCSCDLTVTVWRRTKWLNHIAVGNERNAFRPSSSSKFIAVGNKRNVYRPGCSTMPSHLRATRQDRWWENQNDVIFVTNLVEFFVTNNIVSHFCDKHYWN